MKDKVLPLIPDRPKSLGAGSTFDVLADSIVSQIEARYANSAASQPTDGQRLAFGVYGARGQGKTSFLWQLCQKLSQFNEPSKTKVEVTKGKGDTTPVHYLLPRFDKYREDPPEFFDPTDLRDFEDDLQAVLHYLERLIRQPDYGQGCKEAADKIRELRKQEILHDTDFRSHIVKYEAEAAVNRENLEDRFFHLSEGRDRIDGKCSSNGQGVNNDRRLTMIRHSLAKALNDVNSRVLLIIDDPDLNPHRSFSLLRTIFEVCTDPRFIVIAAADRTQLVEGMTRYLVRSEYKESNVSNEERQRYRQLAERQLVKLLPYSIYLPALEVEERARELWKFLNRKPTESNGKAEVQDKQDDSARNGLSESICENLREAATHDRELELGAEDEGRIPSDADLFVKSGVTAFLPNKYRDLIYVANLLRQWWNQTPVEVLSRTAEGRVWDSLPSSPFKPWVQNFGTDAWLNLVYLAGLHTKFPQLGLVDAFMQGGQEFLGAFMRASQARQTYTDRNILGDPEVSDADCLKRAWITLPLFADIAMRTSTAEYAASQLVKLALIISVGARKVTNTNAPPTNDSPELASSQPQADSEIVHLARPNTAERHMVVALCITSDLSGEAETEVQNLRSLGHMASLSDPWRPYGTTASSMGDNTRRWGIITSHLQHIFETITQQMEIERNYDHLDLFLGAPSSVLLYFAIKLSRFSVSYHLPSSASGYELKYYDNAVLVNLVERLNLNLAKPLREFELIGRSWDVHPIQLPREVGLERKLLVWLTKSHVPLEERFRDSKFVDEPHHYILDMLPIVAKFFPDTAVKGAAEELASFLERYFSRYLIEKFGGMVLLDTSDPKILQVFAKAWRPEKSQGMRIFEVQNDQIYDTGLMI